MVAAAANIIFKDMLESPHEILESSSTGIVKKHLRQSAQFYELRRFHRGYYTVASWAGWLATCLAFPPMRLPVSLEKK
ncbi:hypothetical protein AT6N2_C2244 [Agrobacterium tumefaciens]|nr:hypothetical protein AT6N2_C2244 [Agrobacterium tumefaciens]